VIAAVDFAEIELGRSAVVLPLMPKTPPLSFPGEEDVKAPGSPSHAFGSYYGNPERPRSPFRQGPLPYVWKSD
jgi:hypothetical protein